MNRERPPAETTRQPLSRARIVAGAIDLADAEGVESLTMRKLAKQLGFEVMSLYNHVANKDELLTLMADAVADELDEPPPDSEPLALVRAIALSNRAAFVRHPWAPELWLRCMPGPARIGHMESLLATLDATGLSSDLAHHGFHAVTNHVVGYSLQEREMNLGHPPEEGDALAREFIDGLPPEAFPHTVAHVRQHLDGDTASSFELVLDLILDGLVTLQQDGGGS